MDDVTRTDPLRPIEVTTRWLALVFGGWVVALVVLAPFVPAFTLGAFDADGRYVCVPARSEQGVVYVVVDKTDADDRPVSTGPGYLQGSTRQTSVEANDVEACTAGGPTT